MPRLITLVVVAACLVGSASAQTILGGVGSAAIGGIAGAASAGALSGSTLSLSHQNSLTSSPYVIVVPPAPPIKIEEFPHAHIHNCDDLSQRQGKC